MLQIALEADVDPAALRVLDDAIDHYNMTVTGHHRYTPVNALLRDEQGVVKGGACGGIWGEWLYLKYLWVSEDCAGRAMAANCWFWRKLRRLRRSAGVFT